MVSIKEVAAHAGVSVSTVSKVVNNYPNISEATREKVNAAIRELNYIPNSIASALSSKHSERIAILMDPKRQTKAADEIYMRYLLGAYDTAMQLGLSSNTVFFSMLEDMDADDMTRYLLSQGIGGIVVFGLTREDKWLRLFLEREEFPAVLVDVPVVGNKISSVGIDQEAAQYDVAKKTIEEWMIKSGGKRNPKDVLYISGKGSGYVTADRTKGIRRLSEELSLNLTVRYGDYSEKKARGITFSVGSGKDIIVCASDLMAVGSANALKEMGAVCPVCGFDGLTLMGYVPQPMNTVSQDFYAVAGRAVEELKLLMEGESGNRVILPHSLTKLEYMDVIL